MATITSVGITSGVPSSGTGNVSTIDQLIAVGSPISNGSTVTPVTVAITGNASAVTSTMSALVVVVSPNSSVQTITLSSNPTVILSSNPTITSVSSGSVSIVNGANTAAVKASQTAPSSSDPALVVAISPNSVNQNGQTTMLNSAPVVIASNQTAVSVVLSSIGWGGNTSSLSTPTVPADQYGAYTVVAASNTQFSLGSSAGRTGDYLAYLTIFPTVAASGAVTIFDSTGVTIGSFAGGGTTALPSLIPFRIDIGAYSVSSGWKVTTSSNVSALGVGKFT